MDRRPCIQQPLHGAREDAVDHERELGDPRHEALPPGVLDEVDDRARDRLRRLHRRHRVDVAPDVVGRGLGVRCIDRVGEDGAHVNVGGLGQLDAQRLGRPV